MNDSIKQKLKVIFQGLIVIILIVGVTTCTVAMKNWEDARHQIREENDGIIPGKEALILGTGETVDVMTILHEGKKYTCFMNGYKQMGCVKEFPYD